LVAGVALVGVRANVPARRVPVAHAAHGLVGALAGVQFAGQRVARGAAPINLVLYSPAAGRAGFRTGIGLTRQGAGRPGARGDLAEVCFLHFPEVRRLFNPKSTVLPTGNRCVFARFMVRNRRRFVLGNAPKGVVHVINTRFRQPIRIDSQCNRTLVGTVHFFVLIDRNRFFFLRKNSHCFCFIPVWVPGKKLIGHGNHLIGLFVSKQSFHPFQGFTPHRTRILVSDFINHVFREG